MEKIYPINSPSEISHYTKGSFLRLGNILFRPSDVSNQVIVFFNGGIPAAKLNQFPIFQRWSWHQDYPGTVAFVADPDVNSKTGLSLSWYIGRRDEPRLPSIFATLSELIIATHGKKLPIITFGSSAGGYAAMMSALCGFADGALAINPQTDVRRYYSFAYKKLIQRYNNGIEPQEDDEHRFSIIKFIEKII